VTDWKHYDTIWTERYRGLPQDNEAGYLAGSAMQYVDNLRGRLMLYFGTADDNVHPSNSMELIAALQRAGKSFEVQISGQNQWRRRPANPAGRGIRLEPRPAARMNRSGPDRDPGNGRRLVAAQFGPVVAIAFASLARDTFMRYPPYPARPIAVM
jgi:hypothetical protein